jgi:menaquinone-dependent protoporphyrinogen oxidase
MRVLITVASKHGSTEQLGELVAQELRCRGALADVVAPADLSSIDGYDAVVVGCAVYAGHLMPVARALGVRWAARIGALPNYVFVSGPLATDSADPAPPADALELARRLGSRKIVVFPGRALASELDAPERAFLKMAGSRAGDYRDPANVRAWAATVADDLAALERATVR